jgi:hypothetical protein
MQVSDKMRVISYVIMILAFLSPLSCKGQENTKQSDTENIQKKDSNYDEKIYIFENNEFIQRVTVKEINDKSISFVLTSENKIRKLSSTISGVATLNEGDVEIDVDDKGIAYGADEYIYATDLCWLAFRIDIKTKSFMRINESNCYTLHNRDCPFASIGILKKIESGKGHAEQNRGQALTEDKFI